VKKLGQPGKGFSKVLQMRFLEGEGNNAFQVKMMIETFRFE
jgi:hypothetical protein